MRISIENACNVKHYEMLHSNEMFGRNCGPTFYECHFFSLFLYEQRDLIVRFTRSHL